MDRLNQTKVNLGVNYGLQVHLSLCGAEPKHLESFKNDIGQVEIIVGKSKWVVLQLCKI